MKKQQTVSTFHKGLNMDFNPLVVPDSSMTDALNATLVTMNGNENVLQNDMGNGRVETAFLPEGYVPLGTTSLGGIIYIVSYNPFTKKCQIGSFPSPERNFTGDEIVDQGKNAETTFTNDEFSVKDDSYYINSINPTNYKIICNVVKKELGELILHPGDKFMVCADNLLENTSKLTTWNGSTPRKEIKRILNLRLGTIDSNGRIIFLDNLQQFKLTDNHYTYFKPGKIDSAPKTDLDDYRSIVNADYHIFTSKYAGNLYAIGELETIDSLEYLTWRVVNVEPVSSVIPRIEDLNPTFKERYKYTIEFSVKSSSIRGNTLHGLGVYTKDKRDYITNYPSVIAKAPSISDNPSTFIGGDSFTGEIQYQAYDTDKLDIECIPTMSFGRLDYLKQNIYIDFSLLNTNRIHNTIWQYYKNPSAMYIKFDITNGYIDKDIEYLQLKIVELPEDSNSTVYDYKLPLEKAYSGNYAVEIPFNEKFLENRLYKVYIQACIDNSDSKNPVFGAVTPEYHYLYTNGVYNDVFIEDSQTNFDNVLLPLDISFTAFNKGLSLRSVNELLPENSLTYDNAGHLIKGYTKYYAEGSALEIDNKLELKNSYNTFSLTAEASQASINIEDSSVNCTNPKIESNLTNTKESLIDSEYINQAKWNTLVTDSNIKENIDIKLGDKLLTYNITLYSPIIADTIQREVGVQNYYAPAIDSSQDFSKYGMTINTNYLTPIEKEDTRAVETVPDNSSTNLENTESWRPDQVEGGYGTNPDDSGSSGGTGDSNTGGKDKYTIDDVTQYTVSFNQTYPSFGISAGGADGKGSGSIRYILGIMDITKSDENAKRNDSDGSVGTIAGEEGILNFIYKYYKIIAQGSKDPGSPDTGTVGISSFPVERLSQIIVEQYPEATMVPVFLGYVGANRIQVGSKDYTYIDIPHKDSKRSELFEKAYICQWVSAILFVRQRESESFIPINTTFRFDDCPGITLKSDSENIAISKAATGLKEYVSLLTQLYVKRLFEGTIPVFTVNDVNYVDRTVSIPYSISINSGLTNNSILFRGKPFKELVGRDSNSKNCFKVQYNSKQTINSSFTLDISNQYFGEFMDYKNLDAIPVYVKGGIGAPTKQSLTEVYTKNKSNQLEASAIAELPLVNLVIDPNTMGLTITPEPGKLLKYNYLDMFTYDNRLDALAINRNKVNSSLKLYWGAGDGDNRFVKPTSISNQSLWENASIDKTLPRNASDWQNKVKNKQE